MTDAQATWIAGIIEGEGSIRRDRCSVTIEMTDLDVIETVSTLLKAPIREWNRTRPSHHKKTYAVTVNGYGAAALLLRIFPLLSSRRAGQAYTAVSIWMLRTFGNSRRALGIAEESQ